ncbi:MAG: hypothetical protein ACQERZ_04720 [Fusobacteriota bacterium]
MDEKLEYNGYLILNLPKKVGLQIENIRKKYDKVTSKLPVKITVIGSSGVGPIKKDRNYLT